MYSYGVVPVLFGTANANTGSTVTIYNGKDLFSTYTRDTKFNWGHPNHDVVVKQWDNYGKF